MELKLKLLFLVFAIFLSMTVSPNHGRLTFRSIRLPTRRPWPRPRPTRRPWPSPSPSPSPITIPTKKCLKIVEKDELRNLKYTLGRYIRRPICVQLDDNQKLQKLKDVGGYNPRYVAVNRTQARKFVNLVKDFKPLTAKPPSYGYQNASCSNQSDLRSALRQQDEAALTGDDEERDKITLPSRPGTTTQQCFEGGSLVEGDDFRRMCTECAAVTQLPANVFPPFINEVICGDSDFCVPGIGACQQKVLKFTFLRFTGKFEQDDDLGELFGFDVYVEELEKFEQDIRVCCECRSFSFLGK